MDNQDHMKTSWGDEAMINLPRFDELHPKHQHKIHDFEKKIDFIFKNKDILRLALTHRSHNTSQSEYSLDYERMEFLGDRVLGLAIADWQYHAFPKDREGQLGHRQAESISRRQCSQVATYFGLGDVLIMEQGEKDNDAHQNKTILANSCEALIGAAYLDQGFDAAYRLVMFLWEPFKGKLENPEYNPKTILQEWALSKQLSVPEYYMMADIGTTQKPMFEMGVRLSNGMQASAKAPSKKVAAKKAARILLNQLRDKGMIEQE